MGSVQSISMAQVAKIAGVSHQTVSRVINNFPGVKPQTRERVEEVIRQTGYVPNTTARTLVTKRSRMIGVITVGSFLYGPTQSISSIEQAARAQDYTTLLATVTEESRSEFFGAVDNFMQRSIDALIIVAARHLTTKFAAELELSIPVLLVSSPSPLSENLNILWVDQDGGARLAIRHLIQLGHRNIAFLTGPDNWMDARQRREAATDEAERNNLKLIDFPGDWGAQSGYQAGIALASMPKETRPTAVFSANDHMALGLFAAFHKCGISVPSDISVIGFDNVPESEYYSPPLSTVEQDFSSLGHKVLANALHLIEEEETDFAPIPTHLVIRESTSRPWNHER